MKNILLLLALCFSIQFAIAQPAGMLNETFNLKFIQTNDRFYTPNGENPNFTLQENAGNFSCEANGIVNMFSSETIFSGNTLTFQNPNITSEDCSGPNCYFEDLYFYNILTTQILESKTLTYNYSEDNGVKILTLRDADYNFARFTTESQPEPNPSLFQTWYLYMVDVDLGDPTFYNGPNPPQITINPDLHYTGIDDCALINGDFILGDADEYYDFLLQSENYGHDTSNCPPGPVGYTLYDLMYRYPLGCILSTGNNGIDYFQYESYPGFISYFRNQLILSTSENSLDNLALYPNPAEDKLFISASVSNIDSISITDINGRIVIKNTDNNSKEVDTSSLKAGMYFINISSSKGNITKKFIKK